MHSPYAYKPRWYLFELIKHILVLPWKIGSCFQNSLLSTKCAVPENIHTPPQKVFFSFASPIPPEISSLTPYIAFKILTVKTSLPLGISDDLPWGEYGFFLKLHNGEAPCMVNLYRAHLLNYFCGPLLIL